MSQKREKMTSKFKMADVNTACFKEKCFYSLFKHRHQIMCKKRIYHECEVPIDKSVPRATVYHPSAEARDAKQ